MQIRLYEQRKAIALKAKPKKKPVMKTNIFGQRYYVKKKKRPNAYERMQNTSLMTFVVIKSSFSNDDKIVSLLFIRIVGFERFSLGLEVKW